MGFSRAVAPVSPPEADTLTEDMAGIGMNLGGRANHRANIENTLFFASEEGMDRANLRVLSVLVTWLGVHGARVNVDRLAKLIEAGGSKRVRAFWAAVGRWLAKDRRYFRLIRLYTAKPLDLLDVGTEFQIRRHGEDRRFEGTALRVPGNVLRESPGRCPDARAARTPASRLLLAHRHWPNLPGRHVGGDGGHARPEGSRDRPEDLRLVRHRVAGEAGLVHLGGQDRQVSGLPGFQRANRRIQAVGGGIGRPSG